MDWGIVVSILLPGLLFARSLWLARKVVRQKGKTPGGWLWLGMYLCTAMFATSWLATSLNNIVMDTVQRAEAASHNLRAGPYLFLALLLILESRRPLNWLKAVLGRSLRSLLSWRRQRRHRGTR